jgi:hypothetical protein
MKLHRLFRAPWLIPAVLVVGLSLSLPLLVARQPAGAGNPDGGRADSAAPLSETEVVRRVNAATDRALDYLEKKQLKDGPNAGAWRPDINAINGMAILAFLSRGHVPGRGKYGDTVEDGVVKPGVLTLAKKFLLSGQSKVPASEGFMNAGNMYSHGMATLALVEMYGMDPDPELEDGTRKAVNLILRTQGAEGGWDYQPSATGGSRDLSVSVMQIVAMRAAANAEIPVPETAIKKAIAYVRAKANTGGGYGYAGPGAGPQTSAAGCLSLQLLGAYNDPQIGKTLDYLVATTKPENWRGSGANYYYYFHYYAIQAFYQHGGKHWNDWHPRIREVLLTNQNKDGSWDVPDGAEGTYNSPDSKVYATALATLVLNIYQHFLPAYQR